MKTVIENRLFWFLKEGNELDLSDKTLLDMYIEQIFTRGKTSDIRKLFNIIAPSVFLRLFYPNEKLFTQGGKRVPGGRA